jgi:nucleoside-diphosphate-sugar epimerase
MNPLAADLDHILAATRSEWEELRGRRIFITGGTGFFGCWLLESLLWAQDKLGLEVSALVLTRNPEAFRRKAPHLAAHPALELYPGDVRSFEFPRGEFSHLIHAAAETDASRVAQDPLGVFDTMLTGTRRVLELACRCGARKILLTSSGAVYGPQPAELTHFPEDYAGAPNPTDPQSAYGEAKRAAETLSVLFARQHGLQPRIARCFAFVGPYLPLDAHFAIGNFISDALEGRPIRVQGDGTPHRSYLHGADLALWLWTILFRGQSCRPYHVGSEESLSIAEVAQRVARAAPRSVPVRIEQEARPGPPPRYVPSTQQTRAALGLRQHIGLDDALRRTFAWHQHHQSRHSTRAP